MNGIDKRQFEPVPEEDERLAAAAIDAALVVHKALGPGLMESVYEACLCHELAKRGVPFRSQASLPVVYDGMRLDGGLRLDLLVGDRVIVELKAVERMEPIFEAQLLTYLRLSHLRHGLLISFGMLRLKGNIRRMVA